MKLDYLNKKGFTLIELLVVMGIISVLITMSVFSIQGVRESSRNTRRKSDLETIRQAVEFYRADCNKYPASISFGSSLTGDNSSSSCSNSNEYLTIVPEDPENPDRVYYYNRTANFEYVLCASLEDEGSDSAASAAGCGNNCGSGGNCTYFVSPR